MGAGMFGNGGCGYDFGNLVFGPDNVEGSKLGEEEMTWQHLLVGRLWDYFL